MSNGFLGQGLLILAALSLIGQILTTRKVYAYSYLLLLSSAVATALYAHISDDFSLLNVVMNSHSAKPLLYKISGVWGNHEGSMLLWIFLMAIISTLLLRSLSFDWQKPAYVILGLVNFGFVGFLIAASDPFRMLEVPVTEGLDLNPLLQDPSLAIHPPILYAGYITFVAPFTLAVIALLKGEMPSWWATSMRSWVLSGWVLLSLGLALGSFWAYYELGWGGWWFWDPVESAALVPWLLATALIHTLRVITVTDSLKLWAVCLAILTFGSCLFGTFLVRSGLLTSVHSFAIDPLRGMIILILTGMIMLPAFYLLIKNGSLLKSHASTLPMTRSGILLLNNLLLGLGAATIVLGILYPLILEVFDKTITVGAPFYNNTFVPLMTPLLMVMAVGIWIPWTESKNQKILEKSLPSITLAIALTLGCYFYFGVTNLLVLLVLLSSFAVLITTIRHMLKSKNWGMSIAHFGLAISIISMGLATSLEQEKIIALKPGESLTLGGYQFTFVEKKHLKGPNYNSEQAILRIDKNGALLTTLMPEKRAFWTQEVIHSETSIYYHPFYHLYAAPGESYTNGAMSFRLYYKPFMGFVWLGWVIMALGGIVTLFKRRQLKTALIMLLFIPEAWATQAHEILENPAQEHLAKQIQQNLMCPVCGGQSLDESRSPMAEQMRAYIRKRILEEGKKEDITQELIDQYGASIVTNPALSSSTFLLWFGPWLGFILVGAFVGKRILKSMPKK